MSQQAFYRLRREFVPVLGIERAEFHPSAKLELLIPTEDRIATWNTIRSRIGPRALPDLIRKRHFRREYAHAGELANYLVLHSPHSFKKEWTRDEVATLVRKIIIDDTGVTDFTDDSRFVQDMHLD